MLEEQTYKDQVTLWFLEVLFSLTKYKLKFKVPQG